MRPMARHPSHVFTLDDVAKFSQMHFFSISRGDPLVVLCNASFALLDCFFLFLHLLLSCCYISLLALLLLHGCFLL